MHNCVLFVPHCNINRVQKQRVRYMSLYDIIQRADKSALKEVRKPLVHAMAHSLLGTVAWKSAHI